MFRWSVPSLLTLCMTACPGSAAGAVRASRSCGTATASTVVRDRGARVYRDGGRVLACSVVTGRVTSLGARFGRTQVGLVALSGGYVAFVISSSSVDVTHATVNVVAVRSGRRTVSEAATQRAFPESIQLVRALVVRADGAVAWIAPTGFAHRDTWREVHRVDRSGRPRVLDRGGAIVPTSLRLRRGRLSWRHGSGTRTARLR